MSLQPLLVDPGPAFLAAGNPERFLTDNLPSTDDPRPEPASHRKAVIGIAGAFIAWRLLFVSEARRQPGPPIHPEGLLHLIWRKNAPLWLRIASPVVLETMAEAGLTGEELQAVGIDFATKLGSYINDTSAAAVVSGYKEQLRRGVNPTLAWLRAVEGYGLEERQLRGWVAQQATQGNYPDLISPGAQRALDRSILLRADTLGQTEAWQARQLGKSVAWMVAEADGRMPYGTKKRWLTAEDERVCKICGPLDLQEVGLSEQFLLPDRRRIWAPGVHPNCRCELALVYPAMIFEKARGDDPYDRDSDGQFARQESRTRKVPRPMPVKEHDTDPVLQALVDAMNAPAPEVEDVDPWAQPADPWANSTKIDPWANTGVDPWAVDPFAADPFATDPWGAPKAGKTTGRRRRIYVIINGELTEVDAEEMAHDDQNIVYVPVDRFFALPDTDPVTGVTVDLRDEREGEPVHIDPMRVGMVIDFDDWALRNADRTARHEHKTVDAPMPLAGEVQGSNNHPNDILDQLDEFYAYVEGANAEADDQLELMHDQENTVYDNIYRRKDEYISELDSDELLEIYDNAGERGYARRKIAEGKEDQLADTLTDLISGDVPDGWTPMQQETVEQAFSEYIFEHDPEIEAIRRTMSYSNEGFLRSPEIFTFKDNYASGTWTTANGKLTPMVEGRYRVAAIKVHSVHPKHTGLERPNPRIKNWREVVLERIEDDELPHDTHRGPRGY